MRLITVEGIRNAALFFIKCMERLELFYGIGGVTDTCGSGDGRGGNHSQAKFNLEAIQGKNELIVASSR